MQSMHAARGDGMESKYGSFGQWWRLFDALSIERGHLDNGQLASDYCRIAKKKSDGAYESALKNLNNWRQGLHTPSRRNFRILALLLRVEEIPGALPYWTRLYEESLQRQPSTDLKGDDGMPATPDKGPSSSARAPSRISGRIAAVVALGALGIAGGAIVTLNVVQPRSQATAVTVLPGQDLAAARPVIDMTGQRIPYREHAVLKVGQSAVIHGERGGCSGQPPAWELARHNLPSLAIGTWSDGGVGYRVSRSCGGPTPARAIVFTATKPGRERFLLYEDPITIHVEE